MARDMINSEPLFKALVDAGIADDRTRRVVIDIRADCIPTVHIERDGDARLIDVIAIAGTLSIAHKEAATIVHDISYNRSRKLWVVKSTLGATSLQLTREKKPTNQQRAEDFALLDEQLLRPRSKS